MSHESKHLLIYSIYGHQLKLLRGLHLASKWTVQLEILGSVDHAVFVEV